MSGMEDMSRMGKGWEGGKRLPSSAGMQDHGRHGEVWFLVFFWHMFVESSPLPCSCRVSAAAGRPNHPRVPHGGGNLCAQGLPSGVDGQVGAQPEARQDLQQELTRGTVSLLPLSLF